MKVNVQRLVAPCEEQVTVGILVGDEEEHMEGTARVHLQVKKAPRAGSLPIPRSHTKATAYVMNLPGRLPTNSTNITIVSLSVTTKC
jgi:hypothetical protein